MFGTSFILYVKW